MNQNRITIVHSDFNNVAHMVQTVRWHPGVEMATWLASGSRSGVVRVESMVAAYEKLKVVK